MWKSSTHFTSNYRDVKRGQYATVSVSLRMYLLIGLEDGVESCEWETLSRSYPVIVGRV